MANEITGANVGGAFRLQIRAVQTAHLAQLCRYDANTRNIRDLLENDPLGVYLIPSFSVRWAIKLRYFSTVG